mgnify:FL=1
MENKGFSRRDFLKGIGAGMIGIGALEVARRGLSDESMEQRKEEKKDESLYVPVERNDFFDDNSEYLQTVTQKNGEWSREQRARRRRKLTNGEELFDDVGLTFYLVRKGDTISEIRERLGSHPEFHYLKTQTAKLDSFNIPAKKLRANLWIPIPTESKDRELSEAQFVAYAQTAIKEMWQDEAYKKELDRILQKVSVRELVMTMLSIAKQEGGGKKLGQFELQRWESHQGAF